MQVVYTASIPEDLPLSSVLLRVGATDADAGSNARLKYSLHGPGSQDFIMDPDTGMYGNSVSYFRGNSEILYVSAQEHLVFCRQTVKF